MGHCLSSCHFTPQCNWILGLSILDSSSGHFKYLFLGHLAGDLVHPLSISVRDLIWCSVLATFLPPCSPSSHSDPCLFSCSGVCTHFGHYLGDARTGSSCQVSRLPRWQGWHALEIKAIFRGLFSLLVSCYLYFQLSLYFPVVWLAFKKEGIPLECGWAPSDTVLSALLVLPAPPEAPSFIYLNTSDFFLTYSHSHSSSFYFLALPQCI